MRYNTKSLIEIQFCDDLMVEQWGTMQSKVTWNILRFAQKTKVHRSQFNAVHLKLASMETVSPHTYKGQHMAIMADYYG